jgi:hypothetical protein
MLLTAALTSLGTTSPRYNRQQAMYFPCLGSHLTIWLLLSKQAIVISETELDSWKAIIRFARSKRTERLTLVGRDDWGIGSKREMDSRERNQIGLELVQINVQGTVKSKRGSDGRHDLSNETVEVGKGGRGDAEVSSTNVVDTVHQSHPGLTASMTYASLSTMKEQSECSRVVWVVKTELYGSTTDVDILGAG